MFIARNARVYELNSIFSVEFYNPENDRVSKFEKIYSSIEFVGNLHTGASMNWDFCDAFWGH